MPITTRINDAVLLHTLKAARELSPKGFAPEFAQMGQFFRTKVREGFESERDPFGNPWKPLARNTIRSKVKRGVNNGILKETGELERSFQYRVLVNGVRLSSNRVFDDGTSAEIHQEGGVHPVTGQYIDARPMVPRQGDFPASWTTEVLNLVGEGIDRIFR